METENTRALAQLALQRDRAVVQFGQHPGDVEPHPGAPGGASLAVGRALLEQVRQQVRAHALAGVADARQRHPVPRGEFGDDHGSRRVVFDGVLQQGREYLFEHLGVARDAGAQALDIHAEGDLPLRGEGFERDQDVLDQPGQVDRGQAEVGLIDPERDETEPLDVFPQLRGRVLNGVA